ncbi:hypothetical protein LPJ81_005155 [Coemansia sp. IMI 209127]|nr:hypothetical protein LPJ81_005155 [Coemansia sp. IMI 209127]
MDIEKRILDGTIGLPDNEDIRERTRTQENEDESHSDNGDDSEPNSSSGSKPNAIQRREGPQTGIKGVIADYKHSIREQNTRREELNAAARAEYAAESKRSISDNGGRTLWTKEDEQGSEDELDDLSLDEELVFEE